MSWTVTKLGEQAGTRHTLANLGFPLFLERIWALFHM